MTILLPVLAAFMLGSPTNQPAEEPIKPYRNWTNNAWTTNEFLKYRVHYGIMNAGEIEMSVEPETKLIGQREAYHIHAKGRSYSGFDWFYKVRDHFQTFIDKEACQPLQFSKLMEEGSYKDSDFAIFNYKTKKVSSAKKGTVAFTGDIQDIISAIYYARTLDIKNAQPGAIYPLQVYLDGEVHDLKIRIVGREVLKTDIGKVNAVKVIPMVVADRVFKDQEGLELWVSDDENKVPLRVKAGLMVGSVKVDIMSYKNLRHPLNMAK